MKRAIVTAFVAVVAVGASAVIGNSSGNAANAKAHFSLSSQHVPIFYYVPSAPVKHAPGGLVVRVGQNVNSLELSYCVPRPKPGRFCGGALNRGVKDPSGGNPDDHYSFRVKKGFMPAGLVLHFKNGWLTGTVRPQRNHVAKFQVCVDQGILTKETCAPTFIQVEGAYDGTWTGTINGTESVTGAGSPYSQPYSDSVYDTVVNSTLTQSGGGAQTTIDAHGDASATYQVNTYWNDGNVSNWPCTFNLHFDYVHGTAQNGLPISCQATNPDGDGETATFTNGTMTLTRTK
jgi:hypothetical protein